MIKYLRYLILCVCTIMSSSVFCESITGVWLTQKPEKNAKIKIEECANSKGKVCGKIIWLEKPTYEDGTPKIDKNNENHSLKARPLMNLMILEDFSQSDDDQWIDGTIYNPEDGKTYSCTITLISENGKHYLDVRGYVGIELFGKTQRWMKVDG